MEKRTKKAHALQEAQLQQGWTVRSVNHSSNLLIGKVDAHTMSKMPTSTRTFVETGPLQSFVTRFRAFLRTGS